MKKCPFCGSHSVPWPDMASDYVRGYHLCEHHMNLAVKYSTRTEYDPKIVEDEDKRVAYEKEFYAAIGDCANKINSDFEDDPDKDPILAKLYDSLTRNVSSRASPDYGDPISECIDDALVDQWVAVRIKALAQRGDSNKRCIGFKQNKPDSRCINYASREDGLCDGCRRSSRRTVFEAGMFDALEKAMEIMRNA